MALIYNFDVWLWCWKQNKLDKTRDKIFSYDALILLCFFVCFRLSIPWGTFQLSLKVQAVSLFSLAQANMSFWSTRNILKKVHLASLSGVYFWLVVTSALLVTTVLTALHILSLWQGLHYAQNRIPCILKTRVWKYECVISHVYKSNHTWK